MRKHIDQEKLQAMAEEFAKDLHSEDDIAELSRVLTKLTIETALKTEMDEHLGYKKHDPHGYNSGNNRNGSTRKTLKSDTDEVEINTPRDRNGTFQPQLIGKGQTRLSKLDRPNRGSQVLAEYSHRAE